MRPAIGFATAFMWLVAFPASRGSAQSSEDFASLLHAPEHSAAIALDHDLGSPEGTYTVRSQTAGSQRLPTTFSYSIAHCVTVAAATERRLRAETMGRDFVRCDVREVITIDLGSAYPPIDPDVRTSAGVVFGRYVSPVVDAHGEPTLDIWFAELTIVQRRVRLFIEATRFVWQNTWITGPSIHAIEAPIVRAASIPAP